MKRSNAVALGLALALGVACGGGDPGAQPDPPVIVASNVHVVDPALTDKATVSQDKVVFPNDPQIAMLAVGDVIVGDRQKTPGGGNPQGFLRRVKSVTVNGGMVEVATENGRLTDAIVRGHVQAGVDVGSGQVQTGTQAAQTLKLADGFAPHGLDFSGKALPSKDAVSVTVSTGTLDFGPTVKIDGHLDGAKVKDFTISLGGHVDASLLLDTTVSRPVLDAGPSWDVLPPIEFELPSFFIGPVPVVWGGEISFAVHCGVSAGSETQLKIGGKAHLAIARGAVYEDGKGWRGTGTFEHTFETIGDPPMNSDGKREVKCSFEPQLMIKFYGLVGPYFSIGPYLRAGLEQDDPAKACFKWKLAGGVEAVLGGKVELQAFWLDASLDIAHINLLTAEDTLASGEIGTECPVEPVGGGGGGAGGSSGGGSGGSAGSGGGGGSGGGTGTNPCGATQSACLHDFGVCDEQVSSFAPSCSGSSDMMLSACPPSYQHYGSTRPLTGRCALKGCLYIENYYGDSTGPYDPDYVKSTIKPDCTSRGGTWLGP